MRTASALTVSPSMLCGGRVSASVGGCLVSGGCLVWGGGLLPRGCLVQGGAWSHGGIPACTEADRPCEQNHTRLWKHNLAPTSLRAVKIEFSTICEALRIEFSLITWSWQCGNVDFLYCLNLKINWIQKSITSISIYRIKKMWICIETDSALQFIYKKTCCQLCTLHEN